MFERLFGTTAADPAIAERIPPGQYRTEKFPVLHYGSVPRRRPRDLGLQGLRRGRRPFTLTWEQFKALPRKQVHTDIHCVTRWSKLDTTWEGVPIQAILEMAQVRPSATHVVSHAEQGYTANLPLSVLDDDDVLLADTFDGQPLEPEHGYPLRLLVPKQLLLEELEVDPRPGVPRPRPARLLGALRLQQRRRSVEGRALQRRLTRRDSRPQRRMYDRQWHTANAGLVAGLTLGHSRIGPTRSTRSPRSPPAYPRASTAVTSPSSSVPGDRRDQGSRRIRGSILRRSFHCSHSSSGAVTVSTNMRRSLRPRVNGASAAAGAAEQRRVRREEAQPRGSAA